MLRLSVVALLMLMLVASGFAGPLPGAIFTTTVTGDEVNFNHYAAKEDVYLDGGPGPGAPQGAAGLPDGTYVFQVTNPNGKTLLSTDAAKCRQFTVAAGIITGIVSAGCDHGTGTDIDHGATTVQLVPYLDTPNQGGVYKVWITSKADFLAGCEALDVNNGLDVVDCGYDPADLHGFVPSNSKTDNFKVKAKAVVEIDTRFFDRNFNRIDGLSVNWTDTTGGSNKKWSYYNDSLVIIHEAHVEAVEEGIHLITIQNQPNCTVGEIYIENTGKHLFGPQTIPVQIKNLSKDKSVFIDVNCFYY
jgi:hypothetical protein